MGKEKNIAVSKSLKCCLPNKQGSMLAYSLIILGMMLTIAASFSVSTIIEKKSASSTEFSVQALQTADSGVQLALKTVNDEIEGNGGNSPVKNAFPECENANTPDGEIGGITGNSYKLLFYSDSAGTALMPCTGLLGKIKLIKNIRSIGTYKNTARAVSVEVANACGGTVAGKGSDTNTYGTVIAADGKCWLSTNLGVDASMLPSITTYNDSDGYGWYFQWGRGVDGHQISASGTSGVRSSTDNVSDPADTGGVTNDGKFILASANPFDWRSPANNGLWQGSSGTNNPCPNGFQVPESAEWTALVSAAGITNYNTAFNSSLKLVVPGHRSYGAGGLVSNDGSEGYYWSSSNSSYLYIRSSAASVAAPTPRAWGQSVRCIKD